MAGENSEDLRVTQLGIQNTFLTAVGANVLLTGFQVDPKPVVGQQMLYSRGVKAAVGQVNTKGNHTTAKLTGFAGYNELAYLFTNLVKAATISTPAGATLARDWTFTLLGRGAETPKFWTVETGLSGVDYARFADAVLTALKLNFEYNREVAVDGDMLGTLLAEEGVTPTAAPTEIAVVPVSVNLLDMYVADSIGGLSAGLLGAAYKSSISFGDRRQAVWPIRRDRPSLGGYVETRNKIVAHIELENDAQSYYMMRQMRSAATRFLRFSVIGPEIEAGYNYEAEFTLPFKVTSPDRGPNDKVYQGMYDLESVYSSALGGIAQVRIRTALTALVAGVDLASGQQTSTLISTTGYATS